MRNELQLKIGDVIEPGRFPMIEDAFRVSRRPSGSDAPNTPKAWFILVTDPALRHVARIEAYVERHGFKTYVPRLTQIKRVAMRKNGIASNRYHQPIVAVKVSVPILPRYIPVEMPAEDTPFGRLTTPEARANGVFGFIRRGRFGQPIALPGQVIEDLRSREAAGEFDRTEKRGRKVVNKIDPALAAGKTARVTSGPFATFEALIESYLSNGNVRTQVSIFGRSTAVEMTVEQLAAL